MALHQEIDLAYAAGVLDSDGCVCVARQKRRNGLSVYYTIAVNVTMNTDEVPLWFQSKFGGKLSKTTPSKQPGNERFTPIWRWAVYCSNAACFLRLVAPYLKLKKYRATLAIELQGEPQTVLKRGEHGRILPLSDIEVERKKALAILIREENSKTNSRVRFRAQEIN